MTTIPSSLDSESLVTRIIAELQADPNAQTLLLRGLADQRITRHAHPIGGDRSRHG